MIGIGIDTGGTYTDAVIYDMGSKSILASAKSLTTKENLKTGIEDVLNKMPKESLQKCEMIALSTTLATNACVEHKGGSGKLIFIGVPRETLEEVYSTYGMESLDDIYLLECKLEPKPENGAEPDWERFQKDLPFLCSHCDCISIVQLYAKEYHGSMEQKAADIIRARYDLPVIMGHELFPDLNVFRRGSGALLNARLIPIIYQFLEAVKTVFAAKALQVPTIIVRSDGSLMSEEFTCLRPVETLLCGPAASIMGALELTNEENAVIVDMGGTTTDIAIVKNHLPVRVHKGIKIGNWKTFVKGLFVDTFGLGGDTAIHYDFDGVLRLENERIIPLCMLADAYPRITGELKELSERPKGHTFYLHEYLCLIKDIDSSGNYSDTDRLLCHILKQGPLILEKAARAVDKDVYTLNTEKLEKDGIILRSGLTPTDIMHIKGDFQKYRKDASYYAADFVAKYAGITVGQLCDNIYNMITQKLYCNLVRILITEQYPSYRGEEFQPQLTELITHSYQSAQAKDEFFSTRFTTQATLIGVGAPTHIFLDKVASLLGTKAVIPQYASVANAVGAIVGNVSVTREAELKPLYEEDTAQGYQVTTQNEHKTFEEYEDAYAYAAQAAETLARQSAVQQGAKGELTVFSETVRHNVTVGNGSLLLSEIISVTATGKIM